MEIEPRFEAVYGGTCYVLTIVVKRTANYIVRAEEFHAMVEDITNEDKTYSDLVAYLSYVVNNPVGGNTVDFGELLQYLPTECRV